jgi:hypothetical protein
MKIVLIFYDMIENIDYLDHSYEIFNNPPHHPTYFVIQLFSDHMSFLSYNAVEINKAESEILNFYYIFFVIVWKV